MCVQHLCVQVLVEADGFPGAGVAHSCEPVDMGARDRILLRDSKYF